MMGTLYCRCGNVMNPNVSILQCSTCLKKSLPSITNANSEEIQSANEVWEKLKKTFGDTKGQLKNKKL